MNTLGSFVPRQILIYIYFALLYCCVAFFALLYIVMHCIQFMLYYLHCILLHCILVSFYIVFHSFLLYSSLWFYIALYCIAFNIASYCVALFCISLYCVVLRRIAYCFVQHLIAYIMDNVNVNMYDCLIVCCICRLSVPKYDDVLEVLRNCELRLWMEMVRSQYNYRLMSARVKLVE